jgi:hypothetical protein
MEGSAAHRINSIKMTSDGAVELEELDDVDLISIQKVDALRLMSADSYT